MKKLNSKDKQRNPIPTEETLRNIRDNEDFEDRCRVEIITREDRIRALLNGIDLSD
ncbi:MAG: hypothetical protein K6C08_10560 [Oscillospiraceae bacterium]|nr:hypothetical protein [Oscillospiraceae bacterium]